MEAEARFLRWSCISYASENEIQRATFHAIHWAYIKHDKENVEPHFHLLLVYKNQKKWKTILNEINSDQNTLGQKAINLHNLFKYLTHENLNGEKEIYNKEDIKTDDINWWENLCPENEKENDNSNEIIDDIIAGTPLRIMLAKYGRTIIFQWEKYLSFAKLVLQQDFGIKATYEFITEDIENRKKIESNSTTGKEEGIQLNMRKTQE